MTIEPGTEVDDVVSSKLSPQFNNYNELETVCVTNIRPADKVVKN